MKNHNQQCKQVSIQPIIGDQENSNRRMSTNVHSGSIIDVHEFIIVQEFYHVILRTFKLTLILRYLQLSNFSYQLFNFQGITNQLVITNYQTSSLQIRVNLKSPIIKLSVSIRLMHVQIITNYKAFSQIIISFVKVKHYSHIHTSNIISSHTHSSALN